MAIAASLAHAEKDRLGALPGSFLSMFPITGIGASGAQTFLSLRPFDPFGNQGDLFSVAGWLSAMNPAIQIALHQVGITHGQEDLYPTLRYDPETGRMMAVKPSLFADVLQTALPRASLVTSILGLNSNYNQIRAADPAAANRSLLSMAGLPRLWRQYNIPQEIFHGELNREQAASDVLNTAIRTGDWSEALRYPSLQAYYEQMKQLTPDQLAAMTPASPDRITPIPQPGSRYVMHNEGHIAPSGSLGLEVTRYGNPWPRRAVTVGDIIQHGLPNSSQSDPVNEWRTRNIRHLQRGARQVLAAKAVRAPIMFGQLWLTVFRGDGTVEDLGLASLRVVTTAGVTYIATRLFDGNTSIGSFDFHGFGTGGTAEATGDTALVTEETTQYNPDNTRPTGTPTNPSGNVYRTVGTYSPDSGGTRAITEHGIFTQAATGGGTLLDRSLFGVVNLVASADSLQATYDLTLPAGG